MQDNPDGQEVADLEFPVRKISLLDPSLKNHSGEVSSNLGDQIIFESVFEELTALFPNIDLRRFPTHSPLRPADRSFLKESAFTFFGGTNILSSNTLRYNWRAQFRIRSEAENRLEGLSD